MKCFRKLHKQTKAIRGRGEQTQNDAATLKYLRSLEKEYDMLERRLYALLSIRQGLYAAWKAHDEAQHGKVIVMADQAQQRLHQLGKKLERIA